MTVRRAPPYRLKSSTVAPLPRRRLRRAPCVRLLFAAGSPCKGEGTPVELNSLEGTPFESEGFKGQFLLVHRPETPGAPGAYAEHMTSTGRVFEFRVQGVFTREPGDVFFAGEVRERVGLSWAMQTTLSWLMTVVQTLVSARGGWLYFNPELQECEGGKTERPHLVWRLNLADIVIATPLGETPPPISQSCLDSLASERRGVKLDRDHTFTFVFHSDVVDFIRWELVNLPLGLCGPLEDYVGSQAVHLCLYRLREAVGAEEHGSGHAEENKEYFLRLDVSRPKEAGAKRAFKLRGGIAGWMPGLSCFCGALLHPWRRRAARKY